MNWILIIIGGYFFNLCGLWAVGTGGIVFNKLGKRILIILSIIPYMGILMVSIVFGIMSTKIFIFCILETICEILKLIGKFPKYIKKIWG